MEQVKTKKCAHCGQKKPVTEFYKDGHTRDGLQSWCKQCSNARGKKQINDAQERFNKAVEQHIAQEQQSGQRESKAANTAIDWEQRTFDTAARIFANICAVANPNDSTTKLCIDYASQFVSDYREQLTFGSNEARKV